MSGLRFPRRRIMNVRGDVTGLCATATSAVFGLGAVGAAETPRALPLQESLEKARVDGKYAMLLRQIKVEKDFEDYGAFRDNGPSTTAEYAGYKDLPAGNWVYVYPYWYIWRDLADVPQPKRGWGP